ncbi:hypothetical protein MNEG_10288 [Monoraphidium neglectum]|jgi:hypothetical protein|uniref:Uncharacterized protein n=1 Tax=Monoraphidium neglectum TaxID=145388 RepID=A0A0D2KQ25_9CHLO|nr:hypothetical protein MNEG_10288 [Monoraphidium neglectum]KIY97673.1 hypothetical protein MNEG_10288 [Monoraphidium neglectum]|eukprot:XP_013896693.1 hypothetical protein MNEG_10288 [Monoraphidium neglectum]
MRSDSNAQHEQAGTGHPAGMLQTPQATGTAGALKRGPPDATPQNAAAPPSPKQQHVEDMQQAAPRAPRLILKFEGELDLRGQDVKGAIEALKGYIAGTQIIATTNGMVTKLMVVTGHRRHTRKEDGPVKNKAPLRRAVSLRISVQRGGHCRA